METNHVETDKGSAIEHQNVPVEHRGLHDFLYSSDDEHTATEVTAAVVENGAEVQPIDIWCDNLSNAKIAGVYAVLDTEHRTQYVGYSRNVQLSLKGHVTQNGHEACAFVRVQAFNFPKRQEMEDLRDAWIKELGSVPPGNGEASGMWASTVGEAARMAMSADERNAYEEKKLKLRKAMADTALVKGPEAQDASDTAINNDDWSSVIDRQTKETRP